MTLSAETVGARVKVTERFCAEMGVANEPPVTSWSGRPLPVISREVAEQDHAEVLVALTFALLLTAL